MKELMVEKKTESPSYNRAKSVQDSVGYQHKTEPDFVGSGYHPPERFVPLLAKFSHPANATQRAQLFNQLQRHYGNRYVQRVVSAYRSGNAEEEESTLASEIVSKKGSGRPLEPGNLTFQRLFKSGVIQAKLKIGQPNDIYEQEADRVADEVMLMPEPQIPPKPTCPFANGPSCGEEDIGEIVQTKPLAEQITPLVQREVEEEKEIIQKEEGSGQSFEVSTEIESRINSVMGTGQPLPETIRAYFEPRFGYDFSKVRVHIDDKANKSARMFNSLAYTIGHDVVFQRSHYQPTSMGGKRLLAHELAHVIQQTGGGYGVLTKLPYPLMQRRAIYRGRILDEGSCEHLACNSRWACQDDAGGIQCPNDTRNEYSRTRHKYRPLFTCDIRCENNIACSDNDNWMAIPSSRFAMGKCNQDLVICANGYYTHARVRDRSHREAWEVGHGVQDNISVSPYATFQGSIYGNESDPEFLRDERCGARLRLPEPTLRLPERFGPHLIRPEELRLRQPIIIPPIGTPLPLPHLRLRTPSLLGPSEEGEPIIPFLPNQP